MSVRNLDALFAPGSVAVIGASNTPRSVGAVVMRNLLASGFAGPVMPVNPKHAAVAGVLAYPDVAHLPRPADLAVICTPPPTVPGLVRELAEAGTRAVVVLTAGIPHEASGRGPAPTQRMLTAARKRCLRMLGPNCLGLLVPGIGLNASFAHVDARPGRLAFVSQSGALCTAALDWARARGVGFSHFVSLGNSLDVDVGDVLDYLGGEPQVDAILLYLESLAEARKFTSAARAAARNKPVIVIKSGRVAEGARAAASHTGALAGSDAVYDAAFRRAGMLRVDELDELFEAAETLARARLPRGDRLAILTNGGGPGVIATDSLVSGGGKLAELAPETIEKLDAELPPTWSRGDPVDIIGDAPGERYAKALRVLLEAKDSDAVLVMHCPTAIASSEDAARAVVEVVRESRRPWVLTSWLGEESAEAARRTLRGAGLPTYETPGEAVRAFLHLVRYRRNQELLTETPPSLPGDCVTRPVEERGVVERALGDGREVLSEAESKAVLAAYGLPVVETRTASGPAEAVRAAKALGFPVALKILSPQISHKSDVGGVVLDLEDAEAVREAARQMTERLRSLRPEAELEGFTVQPMARRPGAIELILGASTDAVFGPVVLFGRGGTAVEVIGDRALGLPPLNLALAREVVARTRVSRLLAGYRDHPPADLEAVHLALVRVSQLLVDLREVVELDVNPLLGDEHGVLALDARMRVRAGGREERLAIRPYPRQLEETLELPDGNRVFVRPIRPEDEPAHREFHQKLKPEDVRFRYFSLVRDLPHSQLARYTQIDYDREMAFVAVRPEAPSETLGVVRAVFDPDGTRGEFAIIVRSDIKGRGLGHALLEKMVRYCRERGVAELVGQVLPENRPMLDLARRLGFRQQYVREEGAVEVRLPLRRRR